MQIFRGINSFKSNGKKIVVALGMFDGVHLGHKKVLTTAQNIAEKIDGELLVMTFDTHPKQIGYLLTTNDEKIYLLEKLGIQNILFLHFDSQTANMSAENFLQKDLLKKINPHTVVVGENFKFGKDQKNADFMSNFCKVEKVLELHDGAMKISSTNIRQLIENNDLAMANKLLGHEYFILNQVIHGLGLASKFGVPTANIHIPKYKLLPQGVFKGWTNVAGKDFLSAVSIGFREKILCCESHLLDFTGDIYHQTVCLKLIEKIRDRQKFASLDELFIQVKKDIKKVQN